MLPAITPLNGEGWNANVKNPISEPVAYVEQHFGIELTHVSGQEYRSLNGCPQCGDDGKGTGSDRFRLFADEHALCWCRKCGYKQFVDQLTNQRLTDVERRLLKVEAEQRRAKREREQTEKRLSALERMARSTAHLDYHRNLDDDAIRYWHSQGITDESIEKYLLGFCHSCPTARGHASYTIPYFASDGETLRNIEHRLVGVTKGDKYRPHRSDLGRQLFQAQIVRDSPELLLCEGAKKACVAQQETFPAVGVQGTHGFDMRWLPHFSGTRKLYIAFDPDAMEPAWKLGQQIAKNSNIDVRIASFPAKVDDFFVLYGGTASIFNEYLRYAQRVR